MNRIDSAWLLRRMTVPLALVALAPGARADSYSDSYNLDPGPGFVLPWPGCCLWLPNTIGWYWTPDQNVSLSSILTIPVGLLNGVNNDFDMTVTLYTERPVLGGTELGSSTFNPGVIYAGDPPWRGKPFDTPIVVNAGTEYFVGFSGWDNSTPPGSKPENVRGGINWVVESPYTLPAGARLLSAAWIGNDYSISAGDGDDPTAAPVIKFVGETIPAIPEPSTWALWSTALVLMAAALRRRRPALNSASASSA